jgi:hypothetical protein
MKKLLAILTILLIPTMAWGFNCTTTGCTFNAVFTEPTKLTSGANLVDLANDTVTYTVVKDGGAPSPVVTVVIPASRATGGGAITFPITDLTLLGGHTYVISGTVVANRVPASGAPPSTPLTMQSLSMDLTGATPSNPPVGGSFQ